MPMVTSPQFPEDCLFFIFEQDFELYPGGQVPAPAGTTGAASAAGFDPTRAPERGQKRKTTGAYAVDGLNHAEALVKLVNAAARKGVGDLVWLGFQPKSNKKGS